MAPAKRTKQHDFYVYVDTVVFTVNPDRTVAPRDKLEVLVMRRPESVANKWALPGGLVGDSEPLEDASVRKVAEETGIRLKHKDIHQVRAFGDPDRDDRWRAISIAYMALLPHPGDINPVKDSVEARFLPYRRLRDNSRLLEFDHITIIYEARRLARKMLEDTNVALSFCRPKFTISELRAVYEAFLQHPVDPANFRRKVDAVPGFVEPLEEYADFGSSPGRPAQMYKAGRAIDLKTPIRFRRESSRLRG